MEDTNTQIQFDSLFCEGNMIYVNLRGSNQLRRAE